MRILVCMNSFLITFVQVTQSNLDYVGKRDESNVGKLLQKHPIVILN